MLYFLSDILNWIEVIKGTVGFKDQHGKKNVTAVWSIDLIEEHFQ